MPSALRRCAAMAAIGLVLGVIPVPAQNARTVYTDSVSLLEEGIARLDDELVSQSLGGLYRALELNPRYADAALALGRGYSWLGEQGEAKRWIERALALRPGDTDAILVDARISAATGEIERAREGYSTVLTQEPYNERAQVGVSLLGLSAGRVGSVMERLERLLARYPENRTLLLTLALLSAERGDHAAAGDYIEIALRRFPDMPGVHLLAAQLSLSRGDYADADRHARSAVALQPRLQSAWYILVQAAVATGDTATALARSEELINLDPADADAWYTRGMLLAHLGRTDDAMVSLERAVSIRSDYSVARIALERLILEETELDDVRRRRYATPYGVLAQQLSTRFLDRQAESVLRHALRLDPFNAELRLELAELLYRRGYAARSLRELQIALEFGESSSDLAGRIEGLAATLFDTPSHEWDVDQFVRQRPTATVATFVRRTAPGSGVLFVDEVVLAYIRSALGYRENIVAGTIGTYGSPSDALHRARTGGDAYALLIDLIQTGAVVQLEWELVLVRNSRIVVSGEILRTGNGNMVAAVGALVSDIAGSVPQAGNVIARRFDEFLVSLGRVDAVEIDQQLLIVEGGSARIDAAGTGWEYPAGAVIGTGTVTALDDFVALCSYEAAAGIDRLSTESVALVVPAEDEEADSEEETSLVSRAEPTVQPPPGNNNLLQRALNLFD